MVSAYESRLHRRETVEQLRQQIDLRNQQILQMLKVMKEELHPEDQQRLYRRIREETPQMKKDTLQHKLN